VKESVGCRQQLLYPRTGTEEKKRRLHLSVTAPLSWWYFIPLATSVSKHLFAAARLHASNVDIHWCVVRECALVEPIFEGGDGRTRYAALLVVVICAWPVGTRERSAYRRAPQRNARRLQALGICVSTTSPGAAGTGIRELPGSWD
jgi:hypothetical protein